MQLERWSDRGGGWWKVSEARFHPPKTCRGSLHVLATFSFSQKVWFLSRADNTYAQSLLSSYLKHFCSLSEFLGSQTVTSAHSRKKKDRIGLEIAAWGRGGITLRGHLTTYMLKESLGRSGAAAAQYSYVDGSQRLVLEVLWCPVGRGRCHLSAQLPEGQAFSLWIWFQTLSAESAIKWNIYSWFCTVDGAGSSRKRRVVVSYVERLMDESWCV